jgi:hypothetical protein
MLAVAALMALQPGATASTQGSTTFQITVSESTIFVQCPTGTAPGILCALGGGPGQSTVLGPLTESFTAEIDPVGASYPITSTVTLTTTKGDLVNFSGQGSLDPTTGTDNEVIQVLSGTGAFAQTTGSSGTVQTVTTGRSTDGSITYSTSTYNGTLNGYQPFRLYLPLIGR